VHEGGYGVRVTADGGFEFSRPDGTRIEANGRRRAKALLAGRPSAVPAHRSPAEGGQPTLLGFHRRNGLAIDPTAAACRWLGERMDYGYAIAYRVECRDRAAESRSLSRHKA